MPVDPAPSEDLCSPAISVRRAQYHRAAGLQHFCDAAHCLQGIGHMLNYLVQRNVIEKIRLIIVRVKETDMHLETEFIGNPFDVLVGFNAVYITAASFVV